MTSNVNSPRAPGEGEITRSLLVHEAWLCLAAGGGGFPDRAYFVAAAGEAMGRILVENVRRKQRLKRGGQ